MPPEKPRIGGEIRLRVTSSDDTSSFENGSDLLKPNGLPWSRSLYYVSRTTIPLYAKLREEGFVPDDLHAILSAFPPPSKEMQALRCQQELYTLNDTFLVDFGMTNQSFTIITEQGIGTVRLLAAFLELRPKRRLPYTGEYSNHHLSTDDSSK